MKVEILAILEDEGVDPNEKIGEQTAYQIVEAAIIGALDLIEEG